ncbi:hypothetical protein SIP08_004951 [Klebsiella aerogenes]|uniref:hypothetical protein n=1 Tax=Klebsiella aerogenes TaxID=548 RepID=UPI001CFBE715|nr:hypothetical protein [Klebsiella aerogenes]EKV3450930.1 hypothetical protein [Klebsiella aerogenes]EKV8810928.1 hypothetical protein [Klebsiella aerogenes]ELJ2007716.1 hypothetical protein [Klebsiella aerogenes]ELW9553340.1 hypothetical protein [Klebsiella aerogenes]MCB4376464.1 hypothetical protein [Klebsiella aerogenes]
MGKPVILTAAWVNEELIMAERKNYPERRRAMELELLRDLREKEEKGLRQAAYVSFFFATMQMPSFT